jgi:hypothetical protein
MTDSGREAESTAERAGIVDQQDAVLEAMHEAENPDEVAEPGGEIDPTEGEAPTG